MGFGQTALRRTGTPLLSCALVVLLPVPAAAVTAPAARPLPRAVSSPGPYGPPPGTSGPAADWGDRLPGRLAEELAERSGRGPHATGLLLPPLFGPREHRGAGHGTGLARGAETGAGREEPPDEGGPGGESATGTAEGADDGDRPRTAPGTQARDASGGDSVPAPASPSPSGSPQEQVPSAEAGPAQPWSPAPVAPHDAERPVAGGAEPAQGAPDAVGAGSRDGGGGTPAADTAPAAAQAPTGPVRPVLSLGAGLASLGLGLAFLALRMRRG